MGTFPPVKPKVPPPVRAFDPNDARQNAATEPVATPEAFARAMTLFASRSTGRVLITKSLQLRAPLFVPALSFTPIIECLDGVTITAVGVVTCAFKCEGPADFRNMDIGFTSGTTPTAANYFKAFVSTRQTPTNVPVIGLRSCEVYASRLICEDDVDAAGSALPGEFPVVSVIDDVTFHGPPSGVTAVGGPFVAQVGMMTRSSMACTFGHAVFTGEAGVVFGNRVIETFGSLSTNIAGGYLFAANVSSEGGPVSGPGGGGFHLSLDAAYFQYDVIDEDVSASAIAYPATTTAIWYSELTATRTVTLPAPTDRLRTTQRVSVKDQSGNASSSVKIVIATEGAETIDGAATYEITDPFGAVELAWSQQNSWVVVGTGKAAPLAHKASHQNGGSDEINVAGLSGELADPQPPKTHASSHQPGGTDAMAVDAAAGTGSLRTLGSTATSACAGNDSRLSDDRTASGLRSATTVVSVSAATAPSSGQVLTATGASAATWQTPSSGWTTVTKTADETIQTDTVLGDDAALKFAMAANTTYRFRGALYVLSAAVPDFKWQINGPAAPTRVSGTVIEVANTGGAPTSSPFNSYASSAGSVGTSSSTVSVVYYDGVIANGANAGDLAIQWAQLVSDLGNTTVLKGSYIEYAVVP